MSRDPKPASPFRRFNSSPEVIRMAVMLYVRYPLSLRNVEDLLFKYGVVRFPLSLRNVEDLLFERGYDISYETVRTWWNRFGLMFASGIRRQRASKVKGFRHWRWHLDEMFVKINGDPS
ncbi:MAG: hypothetical protein AB8B54_08280 [Sphingorhabdus sp.]